MPSKGGKLRFRRREFVFGTSLLSLGLTGGITGADERIIRFGLTPVFLNDDLELLSSITSYLEKATGLEIVLTTRRTYQEITVLLVSGQLDAAWICGYPFIKYQKDLKLLAIPEWNGKPEYQSYLISGKDRNVSGIEDLAGDIHAFSDPDSNSGYLVTQALLQQQGDNRDNYFKKTFFTYAHRNVIRAVASGLAQSGSVDGYVWEVLKEIDPKLVSRTKVLRKSDWFGFPPIAANRISAKTTNIKVLSQALFDSPNSKEGQKMLAYLRLSGFAKPNIRLFDGIADRIALLEKRT